MRRDEAREGGMVRDAKGVAEVVNHGGHQGAAHGATGDECGKRDPKRRAKAQPAAGDARGGLPPGVARQVPVERSADRGAQCVIHKLGDTSALPGEDHLGGGVVNAANRRALLVTGSH